MHAHPGALAIPCSLLMFDGFLSEGEQRSAATHVSTWLMASGHVHPRTQKELIPKDTVLGVELMV